MYYCITMRICICATQRESSLRLRQGKTVEYAIYDGNATFGNRRRSPEKPFGFCLLSRLGDSREPDHGFLANPGLLGREEDLVLLAHGKKERPARRDSSGAGRVWPEKMHDPPREEVGWQSGLGERRAVLTDAAKSTSSKPGGLRPSQKVMQTCIVPAKVFQQKSVKSII